MRIEPFLMERWQSEHEHAVELNLSDSGVHPMTLRELFDDPRDLEAVLDERLVYTQTNGSPGLRRAIAALYGDAEDDEVQVTSGGAEANFVSVWSLIEPGDEAVVMLPNYGQVWGLVRALGANAKGWPLEADMDGGRWRVDLERLEGLVTPHTALIAICNPNNPTGRRLSADELEEICRIADGVGAWVLSDEIYAGSELDREPTPTAWGRYERVVVTNSLSKSYGLPGLRLGWLVAPSELVLETWSRHDYTTIGPNALSDLVATRALDPALRASILERTQRLLARNLDVVARSLEEHAETLRFLAPDAGAMLYLRYSQAVNSSELAERLRREKSVLLVPGDHFGMDGWLRIGFGGETEHVAEGLRRVQEVLGAL